MEEILNGKIEQYLHSLIPERTGLIKELEDFAMENNVPIMEPEGIEVLLQILRLHQPKSILEVGSAIGYSAIRMAETLPEAKIVTLERNEARIEQARANIKKAGLSERITLIEGDALEAGPKVMEHGPFDIIFPLMQLKGSTSDSLNC
jgi:predicted O-methyltransferase YrrM